MVYIYMCVCVYIVTLTVPIICSEVTARLHHNLSRDMAGIWGPQTLFFHGRNPHDMMAKPWQRCRTCRLR